MRLPKHALIGSSLLVAVELLLIGGLLAACNFPGRQPEQDNRATAAAETVAAELTRAAIAESTLPAAEPSQTPPAPLATATEVPLPSASPTADCTDRAAFVQDVTVPDDTNVPAGESFDKTWRLRNDGTCTWNSDYDAVFDSGNIMAGPPSSPLAGNVPPGGTVDLTVSLTAPNSDGTHRGNWKLRNANGVVFGLGAGGDVPFFVQIVVGATPTPRPGVAYDFIEKYCDAVWSSGAGDLPCPGSDTDPEGFVIKLDSPKLEDGRTENEPALFTHPEWINNGVISGQFPEFEIQPGDEFHAVIGCLFNGLACDVRMQLNYREDGGPLQNIIQWDEVYDGEFSSVEVDLSSIEGKTVELILAVISNGPSNQDWAFWLAPRIVGNPR